MTRMVDHDAERAVLAACVLHPKAFPIAQGKLSPSDFADPTNAAVFRGMIEIAVAGLTIEPATVVEAARKSLPSSSSNSPLLDVQGRVQELTQTRCEPRNISAHVSAVKRLAGLRHVELSLQRAMTKINDSADPDAVAASAMEDLLRATASSNADVTLSYGELHDRYQAKLREEAEIVRSGKKVGIRFDFAPIDNYTHGMRTEDGDLMVMAGAPGSGKTSVSMSLMRRYALMERMERPELRRAALFESMEMGENSTGMRWSQMIGTLTTRELRGGMQPQKIEALKALTDRERDIPLYANFAASPNVEQLKSRIAYHRNAHNVRLVVVDHLAYLDIEGFYKDEYLKQAKIAHYLKHEICKPLGVCMILIAHSNKASAMRDDPRPRMSDLAGSQQLAGKADYINFVYRPWDSASEEAKQTGIYSEKEAFFVWTKNRNERLGDSSFVFDGSTMTIEDATSYLTPAV